MEKEIPKIFWKYYDLYRRGIITIKDYSLLTGFSKNSLSEYLREISANER